MKLLGLVCLSFHLCLTKEERQDLDVTAIYHVGRNSNDHVVDIHLRTDALGLPVIVGHEPRGPDDLEFLLDSDSLDMWKHENWDIVVSEKCLTYDSQVLHSVQGLSESHQIYEFTRIKARLNYCQKFGFLLMPDENSLALHTLFYYVLTSEDDSCLNVNIYECGGDNNVNPVYIDGETFYCQMIHSSYMNYFEGYSLHIKQKNDVVKLWCGNVNEEPSASWNSQASGMFFRIFSNETVDVEVTTVGSYFETSVGMAKMISPSFSPKYRNVCLTIVFHTEKSTTVKNLMSVYVKDLRQNTIFIGSIDDHDGFKAGWHKRTLITPWPQHCMNLTSVRIVLETSDIDTKIRVGRISSCNGEDGEDIILLHKGDEEASEAFSSIGMPLFSEQSSEPTNEAERCWHDGVNVADSCACPAGFVGPKCEEGCGENSFGKDCNGKCSTRSTKCSGLVLCTPVVGCFCAPGYRGNTCEEECASGTYGNNCTQNCGHCIEGTCSVYTGKCSSCLPGYQLPLCQKKYDYTLYAPAVNIMPREITVMPILSEITHNANPLFYTIQYKKDFEGEPWISYRMYPIPSDGGESSNIVMEGLEHNTPYKVRTILFERNFNSYQGEDIVTSNFTVLCFLPDSNEYHVEAVTNQTSFTVFWKIVLKNANWYCGAEKYEVSWRDGWNWINDFTEETAYTVSNLLPNTAFKFKVRALSGNSSASFSQVYEFSTKPSEDLLGPVRNLKVTTNNNSQEISWNPPLSLDTLHPTYVVKYKCLIRVACQKECSESSGELRINSSRISVESIQLYPFSQYLVTVSAVNGISESVVLGTNMTAPVETPGASSKPPVITNTTVTVYWNKPDVCSGIFTHFVYRLHKEGVLLPLKTGSTLNTYVTFDELCVNTKYRVFVFIQTSFGGVNRNYLKIDVSTLATDLEEDLE